MSKEWDSLSADEKIQWLERAGQGDIEAMTLMLKEYFPMVHEEAGKYRNRVPGLEVEDLFQEGCIGLWKGIRSCMQLDKMNAYLRTCVRHSILDAVRKAYSKKQMPLSSYVSVEDHAEILEIPSFEMTPEEKSEYDEFITALYKKIETLSDFEAKVLQEYTKGVSYQQIAQETAATVKAVDNALQRARKKLFTLTA